MSKHGNAEQKLHVSKSVQKQQPVNPSQAAELSKAPQVPPKGTTQNNQYR